MLFFRRGGPGQAGARPKLGKIAKFPTGLSGELRGRISRQRRGVVGVYPQHSLAGAKLYRLLLEKVPYVSLFARSRLSKTDHLIVRRCEATRHFDAVPVRTNGRPATPLHTKTEQHRGYVMCYSDRPYASWNRTYTRLKPRARRCGRGRHIDRGITRSMYRPTTPMHQHMTMDLRNVGVLRFSGAGAG